ncbi:MAG TPA: pentapeptide MXKDX repeat protein [Pseudolabrys sp.]|nr:pentapeptide MXKDX repeat protein [Pseudolabrys sp.]
MTTTLRTLLSVSTVALAIGLAFAPAAFAQDRMGKDGMSNSMAKDATSKEGMKKDDAISKDGMKKPDAMAKDGMAKDGMKK